MRGYDVLFFDLDHTLIDTKGQYDLGLRQVIEHLYGDSAPDDFQSRFMTHHDMLWKEYDLRRITMEELRREQFIRAWREFDVERTVAEADEFHSLYEATFETTLFAYPGTREMLDSLKGRTLGIITNGSPDLQWKKMTIAGIAQYFERDKLIISELIGHAKPHPSVFQAACTAFGVTAEASLMIGDNYRNDVEGARDFGMDAIWYVPDVTLLRSSDEADESPISRPKDLVEAIHVLEAQR